MKQVKIYNKDFFSIAQTLQLYKDFIVVPHTNIDGDDLGCMLALYWSFKKIKKNVWLYIPERIPQMYSFLPGIHEIKKEIPLKEFDGVITLECSNLSRFPSNINLKKLAKQIINIDHHPDNQLYGDLNWVDPTASALGELIYKLIVYLDIPLDINIATCLYVSILTDCGCFQYSNTTSETHRIVSELLKFPISISQINRKIYYEKNINILKLQGMVLNTLKSDLNNKIVWAILTQKMLKESQTSEENTQHLIDEISKARGAEITMLFKETIDRKTKISFRSTLKPINKVALFFSGGGHSGAAGCTFEGNISDAVEAVVEKIKEMFYSKHEPS